MKLVNIADEGAKYKWQLYDPVSYTHLTLPTIA